MNTCRRGLERGERRAEGGLAELEKIIWSEPGWCQVARRYLHGRTSAWYTPKLARCCKAPSDRTSVKIERGAALSYPHVGTRGLRFGFPFSMTCSTL